MLSVSLAKNCAVTTEESAGLIKLNNLSENNIYVDTKKTPKVKSFKTEAKGIFWIISYPKNIKEFFWTIELVFARLYTWMKYLIFVINSISTCFNSFITLASYSAGNVHPLLY